MKKNKTKYVIISGLDLTDNNRGTAALGYGSFYFLKEKNFLNYDDIVVTFKYYNNFFKKENTTLITSYVECNGHQVQCKNVPVFRFEKKLLDKFGIVLPFTRFGRLLKRIRWVAAINGGDGFSDIYSTQTFLGRLPEINMAMRCKIPLILLPQTIGPFEKSSNRVIADRIMHYAGHVFVRDDKFVGELEKMGVKYEITKDLSSYMKPQPIDIEILPHAVGLNVSGLTYSNTFRTLSGQFASYHYLMKAIVRYFQSQNVPIYLIPHSYNYNYPEESNDDLVAIKDLYAKLEDRTNVHVIDRDMISPQVKYVISQMSFFIGTRMHANFAAIYTKVPLFGLAYSYKFQGAFEANGVFGSTAMINNIDEKECDAIVSRIAEKYKKLSLKNN
ncbi:polysaccharide pyruvyl transferase family protein [Segatella copri]|uniref:polysaccharide pyruvyl transferase family protein n=1 Tax=Segatella copri TaxID=165179 RepID=UPI00222F1692|nr:polysaccharide pyruvyl transferase family protein [Segatella copri]MCW4073932.1 polysaccharide pyruvyl transferase family protein [Segatella copri]